MTETDGNKTDSGQWSSENSETLVHSEPQVQLVEDSWQQQMLAPEHWLRFVFMGLFAFIAFAVCYVVAVLVVIQFVITLFSGHSNEKLREFGSCLAQYITQLIHFLTYNTEDKPFPFADWPEPYNNNSIIDK